MKHLKTPAIALVVAVVLAASAGTRADAAGEITVSAAASLQNAFVEIGREFEAANPGSKVVFNFGASGQLVQQIVSGAPADVLATADLDSMDKAGRQGLLLEDTRTTFASNSLVMVTPADGPDRLTSLADLADTTVKRIALGSPGSVPAGSYAKEALDLAGKWEALQPKYVFGQNVRQVLDYVARGEVDAGFVYATDVAIASKDVKVVAAVPTKRSILYPIAAVKGTANPAAARDFVAWVRSEPSQRILAKFGFGAP